MYDGGPSAEPQKPSNPYLMSKSGNFLGNKQKSFESEGHGKAHKLAIGIPLRHRVLLLASVVVAEKTGLQVALSASALSHSGCRIDVLLNAAFPTHHFSPLQW